MKRKNLLALLLALVMILSLAACGGEDAPPTKEELLETAEEVTVYRLEKDFYDNIVAAKENYVGKSFVVLGMVTKIMEDGCLLYYMNPSSSSRYLIKAKLPIDELKQLEKKDVIRVVGTIADEIETEEYSTYTHHYITLEDAYLVEEITEISGTVHFTSGMHYIEVPFLEGDSDKIQLYGSNIYAGDKVTIPVSELEMDFFKDNYHVVIDSTSKVKVEPAG